MATPATAAIFFAGQGVVSAVYLPYISERQRWPAEKWPRPFELRPKYGQPAFLVAHLESLNFSPRASPKAPTVGAWPYLGQQRWRFHDVSRP